MKNKTQVYLVGAGPGDTGLITVKGLQCLQQADVVLYDKLSNPAFLQEAPPHAELIYVGKIKGNHSLPQEQISQLLVKKAQAGLCVVRLKGGDPYIFGRGGEEAQLLAETGIPFEVVPGITAGFAASAYAGIPLTHRDFTTSVSLVTGHVNTCKDEKSDIDWQALACGNGTLVFYMGLTNIDTICRQLIEHGRPADTPVAIISRATTAHQQTQATTLSDAPRQVAINKIETPALIIVGKVVSLRDQLRWFDRKPLFGKRILIPHTQAASTALSDRLKELGAEPVRLKVMENTAPTSWQPLDDTVAQLSQYDILVLRSPTSVYGLWQRLRAAGKDIRALAGVTLVACGSKTSEALRNKGLEADLLLSVAELKNGAALINALPQQQVNGARILCPGHEHDSDAILEPLQQAGAVVDTPAAYSTATAIKHRDYLEQLLESNQLEAICLTSATSTTALAELLGPSAGTLLAPLHTVAMGTATEQAARHCRLQVDAVASRPSIEAVVEEFLNDQCYQAMAG
ncbi:MAG: uroporphyrinogen-III C-methyltransferase [Desulfuromonas sp.]|nr:uroporphyrinogen-III C-methyltransferase [Desulfuromonas sp.]